jgi:hypothetical protein
MPQDPQDMNGISRRPNNSASMGVFPLIISNFQHQRGKLPCSRRCECPAQECAHLIGGL